MPRQTFLMMACAISFALFVAPTVHAHCDTMDGPVVKAGRAALESADVVPALKWIKVEYEQELRATFGRVVAARKQGDAAREVADQHFLETLVRLHRAGEGEPFTGIKPAGEGVTPMIAAADEALERNQVDALTKSLADRLSDGVRARFLRVWQAKQHMNDSVAAGREYVGVYVEFIHYVEQIEQTAKMGDSRSQHEH